MQAFKDKPYIRLEAKAAMVFVRGRYRSYMRMPGLISDARGWTIGLALG